MNSLGRDINANIRHDYALASTAITAGGGGDNVEVNGASIDILQFGAERPESLSFVVAATTILAATETLTVTANLQESVDDSVWVDVDTPAVILMLTGAAGGSTETGSGSLVVDLSRSKRYTRIQVTPDLSNSATDTATVFGVAIAGGLARTG